MQNFKINYAFDTHGALDVEIYGERLSIGFGNKVGRDMAAYYTSKMYGVEWSEDEIIEDNGLDIFREVYGTKEQLEKFVLGFYFSCANAEEVMEEYGEEVWECFKIVPR